MKYATIAATNTLLARLRAGIPNRPLTFGESLQLASHHAFRVRAWLGENEPRINLAWLLNQRAVPVHRAPRYQLGEHTSGLTTDEIGNRLQIFINQNEPHVRQRFTLAHEFYHAITFYAADMLYARLGSGSTKRQHDQIEAVCNHFAANLLMPVAPFKRVWFQTQDLDLLANVFHVSPEAASTRLDKLGLRDDPLTTTHTYFRRAGLLRELDMPVLDPHELPVAA